MFYFFLIFHLFVFWEAFFLMKKKMKKKGIILFLTNLFLTIINLFSFSKTLHLDISTVSYFQEQAAFTIILWVLLNFLFYILLVSILKFATLKQKQDVKMKVLFYSFMFLFSFYFLLLLFQNSSNVILFFFILYAFYVLIKKYFKNAHNYYFAAIILLFLFTWYSYFTYTGSVRLYIALKGYPKIAYETGLEELKYYQEQDHKKFAVIQSIPCTDNCIYVIEVKNYLFLKIAKQ